MIKRAFLPRLKGPLDAAWQQLLDGLQATIDGQVVTRGEYFFLKDAQGELELTCAGKAHKAGASCRADRLQNADGS